MTMPDPPDNAETLPEEMPPPESIIWTRRNILLFILVVVLGALILAQMCFVALLFASPSLRERVMPEARHNVPQHNMGVGYCGCTAPPHSHEIEIVTGLPPAKAGDWRLHPPKQLSVWFCFAATQQNKTTPTDRGINGGTRWQAQGDCVPYASTFAACRLQSGGLGDAIPQKYPFFFFFCGEAAKKEEEKQVWDCPPKAMKPLR
jgi:hypothetical protein